MGNELIPADKQEKFVHRMITDSVIYRDEDIFIILSASYRKIEIRQQFLEMHKKNNNMRAGIGFPVHHICDLHRSYNTAYTSYQLAKAGLGCFLEYNELGIYKILSDIKEPSVYPAFADETLGALFRYDKNATVMNAVAGSLGAIAAYLLISYAFDLTTLSYIVVVVMIYTAFKMFWDAKKNITNTTHP